MPLLWWHIAGLVLLGSVVVFAAIRGRYVGGEPACRRCGYQLTGAHSPIAEEAVPVRCSECGAVLKGENIVWGRRRMRWRLLVALCAIPLIAAPAQRFLWSLTGNERYHYYPAWWLLHLAESDTQEAVFELDRRLTRGGLSKQVTRDFTDLVVKKALDGGSLIAQDWSTAVNLLDCNQKLSPDQYESLVSGFMHEELLVRPVIRQGDDVAMDVKFTPAGAPGFHFSFWHDPIRVLIGGSEAWNGNPESWLTRYPDWSSPLPDPPGVRHIVFTRADLPVGRLDVVYGGRSVYQGYQRGFNTVFPSWLDSISLAGEIEVLPADAPDPVTWIDDPSLTRLVEETIHFTPSDDTRFSRSVAHGVVPDRPWVLAPSMRGFTFSVWSDDPLPVNLAFELLVQVGDTVLPRDAFHATNTYYKNPDLNLVFRKDTPMRVEVHVDILAKNEEVDNLTIILAASRDVARRTVDIYEIWKGELRFGPFRVQRGWR